MRRAISDLALVVAGIVLGLLIVSRIAQGAPPPKPSAVCTYLASGPAAGAYVGGHADLCPAYDRKTAQRAAAAGDTLADMSYADSVAAASACYDSTVRTLPPLGADLDSAYADWRATGGCPR